MIFETLVYLSHTLICPIECLRKPGPGPGLSPTRAGTSRQGLWSTVLHAAFQAGYFTTFTRKPYVAAVEEEYGKYPLRKKRR